MITSVLLRFAVPLPGLPLSNVPLPVMDKLEFGFELSTVPVGPVLLRLFTETLSVDAEQPTNVRGCPCADATPGEERQHE